MNHVRIDQFALAKAGRQVATIIYHVDPVAGDDPNFAMFYERAETEIQTLVDALLEDLMAGGHAADLIAHMLLDQWRREKGRAILDGTMTGQLFEALGIK